jgi:hypothetical protein
MTTTNPTSETMSSNLILGNGDATSAPENEDAFDDVQNILLNFSTEMPSIVHSTSPSNYPASKAWKFLLEIDRAPMNANVAVITELAKTLWFDDFYANAVIRKLYSPCFMSFYDSVCMLIEHYFEKTPKENARKFIGSSFDSKCIFFEPQKALYYLFKFWDDTNGPSESTKQLFMNLPWAEQWTRDHKLYVSTYNTNKRAKGRVVSNDAKLLIMKIFYLHFMPTSKDKHRIRVGTGNDMVWTFNPLKWMRNMFTNHSRLNLKYIDQLRQFEWFSDWNKKYNTNKRQRKQTNKTDNLVMV